MTFVHVDVPELVRQRALSNGLRGAEWLDRLPDTVERLASEWDLTIGEPFRGGTASYVVAADDSTGRPCVLKIGMPLDMYDADAFTRSVGVHRWAAGRGCARLLAADPEAPAMLLERLGPNLHELDLPVGDVIDRVVDALLEFWRPADSDAPDLPTGADQAAWLSGFITTTWDELDRPCDRAIVDRAVGFCDTRADAFDRSGAVVVHGDAHGWNTLTTGDGGVKLVDPEGVLSERAHDLAVPMREYNEPLLAGDTARLVRQRAEHLAGRCGVDAEAVWQWGFIERVSTGLANLRDFDDPDGGAMFLEVARRCV